MQVSASGSAGHAAMVQQMQQRMFSRADTDGDGSLSVEEFKILARPAASAEAGAADAAFKALDADGDGRLNGAEMAKARPHHRHDGGLSAMLGLQEAGQTQGSGGIEAMMGRMLQAYGKPAAAA